MLAATTVFGVTFAGVASTEEALDDNVEFMKELFFTLFILSSDRVPPALHERQLNSFLRSNDRSQTRVRVILGTGELFTYFEEIIKS